MMVEKTEGAVQQEWKAEQQEHHLSQEGDREELDEGKVKRKTNKGKVESSDIRRQVENLSEPKINHITCNQTQEYFAVATEIGFEII